MSDQVAAVWVAYPARIIGTVVVAAPLAVRMYRRKV